MRSFRQLCIMVGVLSACPTAGMLAQPTNREQTNISPELQARIRKLIATLGPDPTRGTCMPNPDLPTNQAKLELIAIGKPATLPLCAVLKEKDTWRRIMAVEALVEIQDRRAVTPLLQTLQHDPNDTMRGKAAQALGNIKDTVAVTALIEALKHRSRDPKDLHPAYVAAKAALALGNIGDRRAIASLLPLLGSRENALPAILLISLGPTVAEALGALGPEAAEPVMQALKHPNWAVRADAAKALGVMKERQAVLPLLTLLTPSLKADDDDATYEKYKVNVEAVKALGEIGDKRATRPLLKQIEVKKLLALAVEEGDIVAVEALGKIGDPQAVETLLQLLPSQDGYVRKRTLEALWRIKTPNVVEPLLNALLKDDDHSVRWNVAEWLGEMREQSALPALNKALSDADDTVRDSAAVAIGRIDSEHLLTLLQDQDIEVRRAVIHGLGEVGCKQVVPRLLTLLWDEEVGYRAMRALGKLGTPELLPRLEALRDDTNYPHRTTARYAILDIKKRNAP